MVTCRGAKHSPFWERTPTARRVGAGGTSGIPLAISLHERAICLHSPKMEAARTAKRPLNFGWIGAGFARADSATPCVVHSRALLTGHADDINAVLSLHDAI